MRRNKFDISTCLHLATENRAGPSNFGNVISQILLCKQITPDFNQEELCSIAKDTQDITRIVNDMQEYLPQHDNHLGVTVILIRTCLVDSGSGSIHLSVEAYLPSHNIFVQIEGPDLKPPPPHAG
ncbi:hypothetical protein EVAR_79039_1 [Eumeta japonica]|uniref:Uncharacterized protein n=1 Tax=Eumeta variegata TaxID=151549 RepID=A0A4C1XVP0_EUMVA|nr:hypothetical protein EVAR_79039_1 [Eumeta japonica]